MSESSIEGSTVLPSDEHVQRPTQANIHSLPPELLARIMLFSGEMQSEEIVDMGDQTLILSHVSRHWRDVALCFPHLWASFTVCWYNSPQKAQTFLERSKSALLDVSVDTSAAEYGWSEAIAHALRQTSRFSKFSFSTDETQLPEDLYIRPAPFLESLSIIYESHPDSPDILRVKRNLFSGETPLLRSLHLHGCEVVWGSSIFSRLTELEIHATPVYRDPLRVTIEEMIATIRCCAPTLETLVLFDCIATEASIPPSWAVQTGAVTLRRLKKLDLGEFPFSSLAHFLTSVDFVPTIQIQIWDVDAHDHDHSAFIPTSCPILSDKLFLAPYSSSSPSRALNLSLINGQLGIHMWDRMEHEGKAPWYFYGPDWEGQRFRASFKWSFSEQDVDVFTSNIHRDIPLSEIHTLSLSGCLMPTDISFWDGLFRNASNVHRLYLGYDLGEEHLLSIIRVLTPSEDPLHPSERGSAFLLPHLTDLHFSTTRIKCVNADLVLDLLSARARGGAEVEAVTIRKPRNPQAVQTYAASINAKVVEDAFSNT